MFLISAKIKLKVIDSNTNKVIDKIIVISADFSHEEIIVQSLNLFPSKTVGLKFIRERNGWKTTFEGAFGEKCYSPRAPLYFLEPTQSENYL